jgi:hypothetical protein
VYKKDEAMAEETHEVATAVPAGINFQFPKKNEIKNEGMLVMNPNAMSIQIPPNRLASAAPTTTLQRKLARSP